MESEARHIVRVGHAADRAALIALEREALGDFSWGDRAIGDSFAQPFVEVLFAAQKSESESSTIPQGFLVWRKIVDEGEIISIGVGEHHRRQGLAQALLQELEQRVKALSLRRIILDVRSNNHAALALYRRYGYHLIGNRKKYYRDGSDAVVMAKCP